MHQSLAGRCCAPETARTLAALYDHARHFGGIHAVAMAFSTVRVSDAVRARAREMGVALVDSIRKLPAARLAVHLCGAL